MKRILILILIISYFFEAKAQLKDYFIPTSEYFNETFLFQSENWENEKGQFQTKNRVRYYLDPSGNYKKYIENTNYRYNVPGMTMKVHQFFYASDEKIASIYFYIEGISEELEQMGYGNRNINNIILKYPPSQWTDKSDPDVTEYYKSEFGKITTEHGEYEKCIIVTKYSKSRTGKEKWTEKFSHKYYYAYKIGLIKTENYENDKILKEEMAYGGTLIDNFSEYSFYQKEMKEKERIQKEMWKSEEEERNRKFLELRKTTIFQYKEINEQLYLNLKNELKTKINAIVNSSELDSYNLDFKVEFNIDTNKKTSVSISFKESDNQVTQSKVEDAINKITLEPVHKNGYPVNAQCSFSYNYSKSSENEIYQLKRIKNELDLKSGSQEKFKEHKGYIFSEMEEKKYPEGTYKINYTVVIIDGKKEQKLKILDFKGFGGPSNALLSIIVPGLGENFVNRGKGSILGQAIPPWITTVSTLGLVGAGTYYNLESNKNYAQYHLATSQSDINFYYDKANSQHKLGYSLVAIGGALWLADVYWTLRKGSENKKEEKTFNKNVNITLIPTTIDNNLALGLTLKF